MRNWFKKPTATANEMDSVAARYRADRDHWRERAIAAEARVARMTSGLRQNRRGSGSVSAPADGLTTLNA